MEMASSSTARQNLTQPENAFEALVSYSSAPKSTEPWDIFINHYGRDVKYTFATTIYDKLQSMGLHVFLDVESLEAGDNFPPEIQHAISSSTLNIAIFSPGHAKSTWCLAELTFILKTGKKIVPIFYHVEPADLKKIKSGKGEYAKAFAGHEKNIRFTVEQLDEWKEALFQSSFLEGYEVSNNKDEVTVLKNIMNDALRITKKKGPLWVANRPVGLDKLVQEFESIAREERVKIKGIVGMGGSGKTTLAKELYNRNISSFERGSFVFDVRDAASKNALPDKQKKLLADLGAHHSSFDHVDEGKVVLANYLRDHRALILLDDVDHIDQLHALLPNKDKLGSKSMVIVTTRELGVLISWGLSDSCIYRMPGLSTLHAEQLFCWHAFLKSSPPVGFESLVEESLKACNGLPLSLKVLGAQFYGRKSEEDWKSLLNKISWILPSEIKQRLRVSYDALDEEEKKIFLDVACFFIGEDKNRAIAVWDGSGWNGMEGLRTLVNKCLVELVEEKGNDWTEIRIRMHDHLRDMGREIASTHSPCRLWCSQKIDDMKKHSTEIKPIRGIQPADAFVVFKEYTYQLMGNPIGRGERLKLPNGLQILSVAGNEFTEEFASLSEDLVWLRWNFFPLKKFPSWLTLKYLRVLELHKAYELEELWPDNADPPLQLRELILTCCEKLHWIPSSIRRLQHLRKLFADFSGTSSQEFCGDGLSSLLNGGTSSQEFCGDGLSSLLDGFDNLTSLRSLSLLYCKQLVRLPDSFDQLIHLTHLDLEGCEMLSSLPHGFGNLTSLRSLILFNCKRLNILPNSFSQLIHLEVLNLSFAMLSSLPPCFGNLTSLRDLRLWKCTQLSKLPDSFSQLLQITRLSLSDCEMLSSLPNGFGNLKSLTTLNLNNCEQLRMLPDSFSQLIHLTHLDLSGCKMLSSLPDGFGNLTSLRNLYLSWCTQLSKLPDSFSQLLQITGLNLDDCEMLSSLPNGFGNLKSLTTLNLNCCKQLRMLPDSFSQLIYLTDLHLNYCEMLSSLPNGFGNLKGLTKLTLNCCKQLRMLPDSFSQLIYLTGLNLYDCEMLSSLPEKLPLSLKNLDISSCNSLKNVRGINGLINLEELEMCRCLHIEELPSFVNLASLKRFEMLGCPRVKKIEGLEHAKSLERLNIKTWWKVPGIQSLGNVERLKEVEFKCDTISALKPCIQSMEGKECPKQMWIQGSAMVRLEEPIVNSLELEFPDLVVEKPSDVDGILCGRFLSFDSIAGGHERMIPSGWQHYKILGDSDVSYLYYEEEKENGGDRKLVSYLKVWWRVDKKFKILMQINAEEGKVKEKGGEF
ncbi:hypothetical protein SUGI_0123440 [Cryptomeria japonica]|nr:hypothetical protein SUGI_0123440 [Cryptomeria japonica]